MIQNDRAHVYVCGDACMADGVRKSMVKIFQEEAQIDQDKANEVIQDLLVSMKFTIILYLFIHSFLTFLNLNFLPLFSPFCRIMDDIMKMSTRSLPNTRIRDRLVFEDSCD